MPAETLGRRGHHRAHAVLVGHVHREGEGRAVRAEVDRLLRGRHGDVGHAHLRALLCKNDRRLAAHAAAGAGDHADLAFQPSAHERPSPPSR